MPSAPKKKEQGRKKLEAVTEARLKMDVHTRANVAIGFDSLPDLDLPFHTLLPAEAEGNEESRRLLKLEALPDALDMSNAAEARVTVSDLTCGSRNR